MTFNRFSPFDRYYIGIDPGQQVDPTAIAVIRRAETFVSLALFQVGHLERLPLGTPYPGIIQRVRELVRNPVFEGRVELVLDCTGVGLPVADLFDADPEIQRHGMTKVWITSGADVIPPDRKEDRHYWSVPKQTLISTADALLQNGQLRIHGGLPESEALKDELLNFRANVNESGRWTYGARSGKHDDLVLALSLACWRARDGFDWALHARMAGIKFSSGDDEFDDLKPGEGEVVVLVKERVWVSELSRWYEPGSQIVVNEIAALLARHKFLE